MTWNIAGRTVLVTGATSGIGLSASIALAQKGARLTIIGRDPARTESALAQVRAAGGRDATALRCDFSSQASIRALAEEIRRRHDRLHVLVNNAGAAFKARQLTEDGIEATWATNHLAYFLLTHLLLDLLVSSAPARVINVSSIGHRRGTIDLDDIGYSRGGYFIMKAYARSKLGNVLFTRELAQRLAEEGVTVNALHPGGVATNIWSGAPTWAKPIITLFMKPFMLTPEQGGQFIVNLACDPALSETTGAYFEEGKQISPSTRAQDAALARRVWDESARMVGIT